MDLVDITNRRSEPAEVQLVTSWFVESGYEVPLLAITHVLAVFIVTVRFHTPGGSVTAIDCI